MADIPATDDRPPLEFHYRNHRGEFGTRHVIPIEIWRGSTSWHPEPQYFLKAWDLDRGAERDFALHDCAFGDPAHIPRYNPNLRRGFLTISLGILVIVLALVGILTFLKSYVPVPMP